MITPNASNAGIDTRTYLPHPPTIFIFSLPDAIDILGEPVFIPMKLPDGFAYGGGSANTEGIISLSITNGTTHIHYLEVTPPRPIQGTLSGPSVPVNINGTEGRCTTTGEEHQLSWSDGPYDYYLSGTLPCGMYIPMAASLGRLTPESLELVAWNELQPATPLPQSEILNLVFSREWLDSHDTNPDQHIFNVTISDTEFNASFAQDPEDPDLLLQNEAQEDRPVAFLNMPKSMFARFNDEPSVVKINFPDSFFRFYDNMDELHRDLENRQVSSGGDTGSANPGRPPSAPPTVIPTTPQIF
jgi:hypothetical protein